MAIKQALVDSLNALPAGIAEFLEVPMQINEIATPTDTDSAIIASGQAMAEINNGLLVPFSGLTPIELLLRMGSHNPVLQAMVLSVLNFTGHSSTGNDLTGAIRDGFLFALKTLPQGIVDKLQTPIPDISVVSVPSDVDSAILVNGIVNAHFIKVLAAFSGILPVALLLRFGSFSSPLGAMLFTGLEYRGSTKIILIKPVSNGSYFGFLDEFICQAPGAIAVTVEIDGETFALELQEGGDGMTWSGLWAVALGQYSATITAEYEQAEPESVTVSFSVGHWPTFPVAGETYTPEEVQEVVIYTGEQTEEIESMSIQFPGVSDIFSMVKDSAAGLFRLTIESSGDLANSLTGEIDAAFQAVTIDGETLEDILHFTINEG